MKIEPLIEGVDMLRYPDPLSSVASPLGLERRSGAAVPSEAPEASPIRTLLTPLAAFLLAIASSNAGAAPAPICSEGVFLVEGAPIQSGAGQATPDVVTLAGGQLTIASLDITVPVALRATARGTRLRAEIGTHALGRGRWAGSGFQAQAAVLSWNVLMGLAGASRPSRLVILKGLIAPDCLALEGRIHGGGKRLRRSFVAYAPPAEQACPDACGDGYFCRAKVGACDDAGVCTPRPDACPDVWFPVCGCDGLTYSNECEAAATGVSVSHTGVCEAECGTIVGIPCGVGEFCELPVDTCETADLGGICVRAGPVCTHQYDPVCGCDGRTYGNDCERRAAHVSKAHDGACGGDGVK